MSIQSGRIEASLNSTVSQGLDLTRSVIGRALGVWMADPAASFLAGQVLSLNAAGQLQLCTGAGAVGIAKWNKATSLSAVVINEAIVLTGTAATSLKHAGVSNVKVTSLDGATTYVVTTDYVVGAVNGTITRNGGGAITSGQTVLVSYRYAVPEADLDFEGRNFFNFIDDVTIAQGRVAVIQGLSTLFSCAFDPSQAYAIGDSITCGANGNVTKGGGGDVIGKVVQLPTAQDPYLGYNLLIPHV